MKSLMCGDGKLFVVRIEGFMKVGDLAIAIKQQRASVITCEAADMALFLAKKGPNSPFRCLSAPVLSSTMSNPH